MTGICLVHAMLPFPACPNNSIHFHGNWGNEWRKKKRGKTQHSKIVVHHRHTHTGEQIDIFINTSWKVLNCLSVYHKNAEFRFGRLHFFLREIRLKSVCFACCEHRAAGRAVHTGNSNASTSTTQSETKQHTEETFGKGVNKFIWFLCVGMPKCAFMRYFYFHDISTVVNSEFRLYTAAWHFICEHQNNSI